MPEAPAAAAGAAQAKDSGGGGAVPFTMYGVAVKFGLGGIGGDVATNVARKLNVRVGGSFFSYSTTINTNGLSLTGSIKLQSVDAKLDYYPFGGGFRISPGVILYNGNNVNMAVTVPVTSTFTLNNTSYTPSGGSVGGNVNVQLGNKVAPAFTFGWGNMLPRKGGHWSVPFELGVEYIGQPSYTLGLTGSACVTGTTNCASFSSTGTKLASDLAAQQSQYQNDLSKLKGYPIMSIGLGYKF